MELAVKFEQKIAAANENKEAYLLGLEHGKFDLQHDDVGDILSSFAGTKFNGHPDQFVWLSYSHGYAKGSEMDDLDKLQEIKRMMDEYGRLERE